MVATWTSEFETGIDILDSQSKELFRILRDLEQMVLTQCKQYQYNDFVRILCEIIDFMTYHFYTEENIMQDIGYLEMEQQLKAHEAFKTEISKVNYIELKENPLKVIDHIRAFIELWIMQHVLLEDTKIGKHYKQHKDC